MTSTPDPAPGRGLCVLLSHAFDSQTLVRLRSDFPEVQFERLPADGSVPEGARHARALLRKGMSHEALHRCLDDAPGVEWIHTASAGFNWVLTPRVAASPIRLTRTANVLDKPIAEFVVALALALWKDLPGFFAKQQRSEWSRPDTLGTMTGGTAVIVGAGAIGRETALRLSAMGMTVLGMKRTPDPVPGFDEVHGPEALHSLLRRADLVVVACPLTPETRHLIGKDEFESMKTGAILVNIARGEVLVEAELVKALRSGAIAGAALDVFETEPLPADNPLWGLPNAILTPHVSYLSDRNEQAMLEEFAQNLRRFQAGQDLNNQLKSRELGY